MKVILKKREWLRFLDQTDSYETLWDLIPQEMQVTHIEQIVWVGTRLYHLSYRDRFCLCWKEDIEEFFYEDGDEQLFPDL